MAKMFGLSKAKPDPEMQKAQRRQSKAIDDQTADEARELGSRNRALNALRKSGGLFGKSGAKGVAGKETLG